jgi:hypothetical protein
VSSLGSNKLHEIIDSVCHKINTPAAFIVSKGVMMWYSKVVDIDSIAKRIEQGDFSEVAKKVIKFMVIDHCSMHSIRYDERQKISSKLEIPARIVDKGSRHK